MTNEEYEYKHCHPTAEDLKTMSGDLEAFGTANHLTHKSKSRLMGVAFRLLHCAETVLREGR